MPILSANSDSSSSADVSAAAVWARAGRIAGVALAVIRGVGALVAAMVCCAGVVSFWLTGVETAGRMTVGLVVDGLAAEFHGSVKRLSLS